MNRDFVNRYYHPVSADEDRQIRAVVTKMLVERSDANFDSWFKDFPGLKEMSGRERLDWYRHQPPEWLMNLIAIYPQVGRAAVLDWASLAREYGSVGLAV